MKNLKGDDITITLQWAVAVILTPFVLVQPPDAGTISIFTRVFVVSLLYGTSLLATLLYLFTRGKSDKRAERVVAYMALVDVGIVLMALMLWRKSMPDLFWVLILMVVVAATRFGHAVTLPVTIVICGLYTAVMVIGADDTVSMGRVISDALLRSIFLIFVAGSIVYVRRGELQELECIKVFSESASRIGSTLDPAQVLRFACEGISRILKGASVFAYRIDRRTAKAHLWECYPPGQGKAVDAEKRPFPGASQGLRAEMPDSGEDEGAAPVDKDITLVEGCAIFPGSESEEVIMLPADVNSELGVVFMARIQKPLSWTGQERVEVCKSIAWLVSAALEKCVKYTEEKRMRAETDSLYKTLRKLGSSISLSDVALTACRMVIEGMGVRGSSLFLLDDQERYFFPAIAVESSGFVWEEFSVGNEISVEEIKKRFPPSGQDTLIIDKPKDADFLPPFLRAEGIVALSPLYLEGKISGLICASDEEGKYFSDNEMSRFRAVASEAGLAISNARLHDKISSDAAQLSSLMNITNAIGSTNNLATIMTLALDTVRHLFDCKYGLIYRIDETEGTLKYVDSFGYPEHVLKRIALPPYLPVGECPVASGERIYNIGDLSSAINVCRVLKEIRHGSSVCVALRAEKKTLGVLHLQSTETWAFRDEDSDFIMAIADQVAIALQRASLFEEVNRLAVTDPLTGVFNLRRLDASLRDEFSRAKRYRRPLSFLMVDVDRLKVWNDTLGHQHGDLVLSKVASILDSNTRDVDKVFRYGGDEFCVLLPETDLTEAVIVAEKLKRAVEEYRFPGEEKMGDLSISISVGVSSVTGVVGTPDELVKSADEALYEAKRAGGNSVAVSRSSSLT